MGLRDFGRLDGSMALDRWWAVLALLSVVLLIGAACGGGGGGDSSDDRASTTRGEREPSGSDTQSDWNAAPETEGDDSAPDSITPVAPRGENELLVVQAGDEEVLLPMTREVVREVDLEGGRMSVSVPEGLRVSGGEGVDL